MKRTSNSFLLVVSTFLSILSLITGCSRNEELRLISPVEPINVLQTMELADDNLEIELFASEPLISDPVAMEIDELGRMYVVEMPGYPDDIEGSGRVKLLRDTDGDGYPDTATIFASGLILPNGIMRWKEGVLVTDAPDLIYLEDSTGDGVANIRKTMITGFATTNPQHRYNKPLYGLDNWIYLANKGIIRTEEFADLFGDEGSNIHFVNESGSPVLPQNANGRNLRIRPDSLQLEILSGSSQFGHDFDAWGSHFLLSNAHHNYHEAIAKKYVDRNRDYSVSQVVQYTPTHGNAAEIYPITDNPEHQLLTDVGVITSASGMTYYLGGLFGEQYNNVTFIAESVHNIVHADKIEEIGPVYKAERLFENKEFLASTDGWFRPVNFYIGPDGALYILDYYRRFVEHPEWMDEQTIQTENLFAGIDRGRIYRIAPADTEYMNWLDNLELNKATAEELTSLLDHQNIWWRRTAQRLIVDKQSAAAVSYLEDLLASGTAVGRLHALFTLDGLGELKTSHISDALLDREPGIRVNAIKLAENRLNDDSSLLQHLLTLKNDPSAKVQYQLLLTLGDFEQDSVREVRDKILAEHIEDEWFQIAALTAKSIDGFELYNQAVRELTDVKTPGRLNYFRRLGELITAGNKEDEIDRIIQKTIAQFRPDFAWWQSATILGVADQIQRMNFDPVFLQKDRRLFVSTFLQTDNTEFRNGVLKILEVIGLGEYHTYQYELKEAKSIATDGEELEGLRVDAIRLLGLGNPNNYKEMLFKLIDPSEPASVQKEALRQLAKVTDNDVAEFVLSQWETMTPEIRDEAVNVLMTNYTRIDMLLDAVESKKILISTVGRGRGIALIRDSDHKVSERATNLLHTDSAERQKAIKEYAEVLEMRGNRDRGKEVFSSVCSACHQVNGEHGVPFGPDLATVRHWTPSALLSKILNPNRSIANGYEMWVIERKNDSTISGVVSEETTQSVTLQNAGGNKRTVVRSDIEAISATNTTVMPEGLEQQIDKQEIADLIEYIRRGGG